MLPGKQHSSRRAKEREIARRLQYYFLSASLLTNFFPYLHLYLPSGKQGERFFARILRPCNKRFTEIPFYQWLFNNHTYVFVFVYLFWSMTDMSEILCWKLIYSPGADSKGVCYRHQPYCTVSTVRPFPSVSIGFQRRDRWLWRSKITKICFIDRDCSMKGMYASPQSFENGFTVEWKFIYLINK